MAMDYPPEKLHVYVSDDGGSSITLNGMKEAWKFVKWWIPFCTRYRILCRCPEAYFSDSENDSDDLTENVEFIAAKRTIKVIQESSSGEKEQVKLPLLVYVSREKRPSHPHHFKAGALNALYRVSAVISNSPYTLVLDCDMFCSEPASARQAMCFHLDPKLSTSLAFVQFPQKFHNISKNDIYDSQHRSAYKVLWQGMDGLDGPLLSGTGFYIKRESLYRNYKIKDTDFELQEYVGTSNEFIKSLKQNSSPIVNVGFLYGTVCEDVHTGIMLNCNGWNSVYCDPPKPQFLGNSATNLNDLLIQGTRWSSGLLESGLIKICPLLKCPLRMSLLFVYFLEFLCTLR
ncbi:hypothetical protein TSUD_26920 [Trifolium subterraneum]|uniref:Uncharacterized protein n=1 Tax=Trifolium subterraneum TaxID=3900 RepID=A0A2Z6LVT3_TRISU|nr:hypothetical protein TSUD_26920 [Trifolium subterraneum]